LEMKTIILLCLVAICFASLHGEEKKVHNKTHHGLTAGEIERLIQAGLKAFGEHGQGHHEVHNDEEHIHINVGAILNDAQVAANIYKTLHGEEEKKVTKKNHTEKGHKKAHHGLTPEEIEKLIQAGLKAFGGHGQGHNEFHNDEEHIHINVGEILSDAQVAANIYKTLHGEEEKKVTKKNHTEKGHKNAHHGLTPQEIEKLIQAGLKAFGGHGQGHHEVHNDEEHIHINVGEILNDAQVAANIYKTLHGEEEKKAHKKAHHHEKKDHHHHEIHNDEEHIHINVGEILSDAQTAANIYKTLHGEELVDVQSLLKDGFKTYEDATNKTNGHVDIAKVLQDGLKIAADLSKGNKAQGHAQNHEFELNQNYFLGF